MGLLVMVDYWSKLEITDCWSEKERFNFVMSKIEESIVGDSELAERINEVISDLENIYIPVKVSDLENDVGFINEHQSLDEYITKSDTLGLVKNDGTIDTKDYVINENGELIHEIEKKVSEIVKKALLKPYNYLDLKNQIILELNLFITEMTGRRPIILPVIMEVKDM
jgi:hypothetical protein